MAQAYYNEIDPFAAAWLRILIQEGHIAPGEVDERSIEDVLPTELVGYTQCHFFAGIGVWSYALRTAGWPDDRPVWTGSCPCQPFSQAGKGAGTADERHLWPAWLHLIQHGKKRDVPVFGEQVASKDGLAWLDIVHADLEAEDYAVRPVDICAAGFGAPNIRQRLYFHAGVALGDTSCVDSARRGRLRHVGGAQTGNQGAGEEWQWLRHATDDRGAVDGVAHGGHIERGGRDALRGTEDEHGCASRTDEAGSEGGAGEARERPIDDASVCSAGERLAVAEGNGGRQISTLTGGRPEGSGPQRLGQRTRHGGVCGDGRPGPANGFWRTPDWLFCRDEKWRPVEPGTFPLVDGATNRVGALRGYGNGLNAETAIAFVESVLETEQAFSR